MRARPGSGTWLTLASAALLAAACARAPEPPSFVIVLVDTLRADFLGCYGFQGPVSPSIDAVARESYVFTRCYASAPWTKPSVATLFTSLNPTVHRVTSTEDTSAAARARLEVERGVLRDDAYTLAERLRDAGYRTGAFVANPWVTAESGFAQGFDRFDERLSKASTDRLAEAADAWLAEDEGPFLLYLHAMEVHAPYNAPDPAYGAVAGCPGVRSDVVLPEKHRGRIPGSLLGSTWAAGDPGLLRLETWRGRYAAGVRDFDDRFGAWLSGLRERGVLDRAYLVITSDHGEALYEQGYFEHGFSLYENQIHVPLIVRPPGGLSAEHAVDRLMGLIDVLPTLVAIVGGAGEGMDGRDLAPLLDDPATDPPRLVVSGGVRRNADLFSVVAGDYKLIHERGKQIFTLFDVVRDPGETVNLGRLHPGVARRMQGYLAETLAADRRRPLFESGTAPMSRERRELLESLGYTN